MVLNFILVIICLVNTYLETRNIALNACVLEWRDSELPAKETEAEYWKDCKG